MQKVYLDNAATTRIRPEVLEYMQEAMGEIYGNPSSTHSFGRAARARIEEARKLIAKTLHAHPSEIVFTAGGTEADNMALIGAVRDLGAGRIITSRIEHHAVLHTAEYLERTHGIDLDYVNLDAGGHPDLDHLRSLLEAGTKKTLISLMHVNNEIGNITDIKAVTTLAHEYDALVHTDAVQSVGHLGWNLEEVPVDFLAASAHKFHGPKGVGFLYQRKIHQTTPLIHGGEQERGHRAGTESFHNIAGMEKAFSLAYEHLDKERDYIRSIKKYFIDELQKAMPGVAFNGYGAHMEKSIYTQVNARLPLPPAKADMLLFQLDLKGIACSRGSACQSGSQTGSHVLREVLDEEALQQPSLRFSFSVYTTREEIDYVMEVLGEFGRRVDG